jgi:hypothetical protein
VDGPEAIHSSEGVWLPQGVGASELQLYELIADPTYDGTLNEWKVTGRLVVFTGSAYTRRDDSGHEATLWIPAIYRGASYHARTTLPFHTNQRVWVTKRKGRLEIISSRDHLYRAECTHGWQLAASDPDGVGMWFVQVDTNDGGATKVYIPPGAEGRWPNLSADNIVHYMWAIYPAEAREIAVAVGDYLDDSPGTIKMFPPGGMFARGGGFYVPTGWAQMNGSANSAANGGSGIDMTTNKYPVFGSSGTLLGTTGGDTLATTTGLDFIERLFNYYAP